MAKKMPPIHPGEILDEEFLKPLGVSQYRLARDIKVDPRRINAIVLGKRAITADTGFDLGPTTCQLVSVSMIWPACSRRS